MVCDYPGNLETAVKHKNLEIAAAIREAGHAIAQAILIAFLDDNDRQEQHQISAEQAEIERVLKLQRGESYDNEARGIGDS